MLNLSQSLKIWFLPNAAGCPELLYSCYIQSLPMSDWKEDMIQNEETHSSVYVSASRLCFYYS